MSCSTGACHTICLSNDGILHGFGSHDQGQLGLGTLEQATDWYTNVNDRVTIPTLIPNLPKIKLVSCGGYFTVCVDEEGFMWSFGCNNNGQLGTGNKIKYKTPQKIEDVPPIQSISCGEEHTLIVTTDSNLWSCGNNAFAQLFLKNTKIQLQPEQTSYSNVAAISAGAFHSLFQNYQGEIYGCGYNYFGELGLGHSNHPQIDVTFIPNQPLQVVQFCCGSHHTLYLDISGNIYSSGYNLKGSLGRGDFVNQNTCNQIENMPPMKYVACVAYCSYAIDLDGNLWSFGDNGYAQLGFGNSLSVNVPSMTPLKNIQQVSSGSSGLHFLAKDCHNKIHGAGINNAGQLGLENTISTKFSREMSIHHSNNIWGKHKSFTRAKSARK